jgi:formylmethanofuran dehydrogenase subunit E
MIRCAQCGQLMPEPDECVIEPLCEGCVYNNQHQGQNEQWEDE